MPGQLVTVGAQLVTVTMRVLEVVEVVILTELLLLLLLLLVVGATVLDSSSQSSVELTAGGVTVGGVKVVVKVATEVRVLDGLGG